LNGLAGTRDGWSLMDPFLDMRGRCKPHGKLRESLCHILTMRSSEMPNILMLITSSRVHSESLNLVLMSMSYTALIVPALLRPLLSPSQPPCRRCAQTNDCGRVIRNTASTRDGREVRCGGSCQWPRLSLPAGPSEIVWSPSIARSPTNQESFYLN
jgi:hypothetical protein